MIGRGLQFVLATVFGLTAAASPLSMASCPQHGVVGHEAMSHAAATTAAVTDDAAAATPDAADHSTQDPTEDSDPRDGEHDHDGPCCCLGHCCPGGSTAHPAASDGLLRLQAALALPIAAHGGAVRLTSDPWSLPYANAPPAIS